ncbi:hypothetical protein LEN26_000303 [Aphanomyces euteiches]|uniref:RING finger protein 141 n=1 Tax=Aphanomyces euteiches TaxID=100861 RepID=A0A6G0X971_9STRA|nr:hypothetical protein Ae201684_007537 [Aphanomyces euteiches]KAH9103619.1 hypothetical protein AeMF1_020075 [Aphanomyces euteiches]KAH9132073.1 hypothetical protein AeRB84_021435 [Aphanomyces euteiches]KAH9163856.1 hypothetical protein LEN26_000303 [Aphanomyces euteiches]KAH9197381.1 hypothetical protein AeNC1_000655 [Aphanomyces euteiches]
MGQRASTEESRMQDRASACMGSYVDLGKHVDQANEWAKLCPTPKTCQLRFRIVLNERIAPELIPFMWKLEGNVMIEVRKFRRRHAMADESDTYIANSTIGAAKCLTLSQFYYIYCFLSDINDCAMHSVALNPLFSSEKDKDFDDRECQICMDKEKEVVLSCTHSFCLKCFQTWSAQNQTCPICRSRLQCAEGEELWHLSSSRGISNITSYAQDLVSRIYEFLDKQAVSRFTEQYVHESHVKYTVWRMETIQHQLLEQQPQDGPLAVDANDELHPDYIFALALAGGEDQELALEECRMHFPTLTFDSSGL